MTNMWWWIERSHERPNGFSMYLIIVCFVKFYNMDHGLVREHPWIGNSGRSVVSGIHSVVAMGYWWATSFFVKIIIHIMLCMYVYSKILVPLGICWLCIDLSCLSPMLILCGMLGLNAFMFFMWVLGKTSMLKEVL
jgi:hypothetical protein